MKIAKFSSVIVLSFLFMWIFMPQLSAKHHHNYKHRSSSFSFNLNLGQALLGSFSRPHYYEEHKVIQRPYIEERVYYPTPYKEVIVERPYTERRIYIQPQHPYSYHSYWRY